MKFSPARIKHQFLSASLILSFAILLFFCPGSIAGQKVVIDAAGRHIAIKQPFKRIISLYGAHTENLFALGLDQEIIGVSQHEIYPEAAKKKPVFSYHDGLEKFLAARPDLILIRPMIDRGYSQLVSRLEKNGITVVSLQPHGIDGLFRYWLDLGLLSGRSENATSLVNEFKKSVQAAKTRSTILKDKPRVYFEAIHRRMKTFAPGALALFCLKTAGGVNVAADAVPVRKGSLIAPYGKEKIISLAHKIDIFLAQKGTMNKITLNTILQEPGFQIIKAVKRKKVFLIDETIVSRPTPRLTQGIKQIEKILR